MTKKEAAEILQSGGWWDELNPDMSDADADPLHEALDVALAALDKPRGIDETLRGWAPVLDRIAEKLGRAELLAQLAEEAAELSQAALKLRRALEGKNPTPVTETDAEINLQEELADVLLCAETVGINRPRIKQFIRVKAGRWLIRVKGADENV